MADILPTGDVMKESVTKGRPDQKTTRKKRKKKKVVRHCRAVKEILKKY
jgi:hypothetical protein